MMNMNSGYSGYSMSNNAVNAYSSGEMPLSKWTKEDIIYGVKYIASYCKVKFDADSLNKYTKDTLKNAFLKQSSWHHTSSYCNRTDFYSVDEDKVMEVTNEDLKELELERKKKSKQKTTKRKAKKCGNVNFLNGLEHASIQRQKKLLKKE